MDITHRSYAMDGELPVRAYEGMPGIGPWADIELSKDRQTVLTLTSAADADRLIRAATEAKRHIAGPAHPFTRPGQVTPDRPAPDTCMTCGEPEAAHALTAAQASSKHGRYDAATAAEVAEGVASHDA